jgi:hypothetical protein
MFKFSHNNDTISDCLATDLPERSKEEAKNWSVNIHIISGMCHDTGNY